MMNNRYKIFVAYRINEKQYTIDFHSPSSYTLEEAIERIKDLRKLNQHAELYPEEYALPKIEESDAWEIAGRIYETAKKSKPHNYGKLWLGTYNPVFYSFYCRDYECEASGKVPGYFSISIDKLDGRHLNKGEVMEYYHVLNGRYIDPLPHRI